MNPCNASQAICIGINEAVSNCVSTGANTKQGFLQALLDPSNEGRSSGVIQSSGDVNRMGHKASVKIDYKQRACEAEVGRIKSCDPCDPKEWICAETPDLLYVEHCVTIREADLRLLDVKHAELTAFPTASTGMDMWRAQNAGQLRIFSDMAIEILKDLDPVRRVINKDLLAAADLCAGNWFDGSASATFSMLCNGANNCGTAINNTGILELEDQFSYTDCADGMILVGDGAIKNYTTLAKHGCCNSSGVNLGSMAAGAPFKFYNDKNVGALLGSADDFIAWVPGSLQLMHKYNENQNPYATSGAAAGAGGVIHGTFPDPMLPGWLWDFTLIYDACTKVWTMRVYKHYNLWCAPKDIYANCDPFAGLNGVMRGVAQVA